MPYIKYKSDLMDSPLIWLLRMADEASVDIVDDPYRRSKQTARVIPSTINPRTPKQYPNQPHKTEKSCIDYSFSRLRGNFESLITRGGSSVHHPLIFQVLRGIYMIMAKHFSKILNLANQIQPLQAKVMWCSGSMCRCGG